jgi:two-component system, chemotaxis family, protein-glutamate methylesterase/glutaminase
MSLNADFANPSSVRVLVVDDSAFMRIALSRMIASEPEFEVVGTACDGSEALTKIPSLNPDIITLDIQMPGLDGLATLRCIMNQFPRPVIMVSSVTESDAHATFTALGAGAFDYVPKQMSSTSLDIQHIREDLVAKIRAAAHSRKPPISESYRKPPRSSVEYQSAIAATPAIVALGASTGGPKALEEILPLLPRDLSVPVLVVQHMPYGFTAAFAQRLNSMCAVEVHEATHDEPVVPGVVYIAPAGIHMTVNRRLDSKAAVINLEFIPDLHQHMPSVDVMMRSVAHHFRNLAMGVILTGMGTDGAEGMHAIRGQGGLTIGQDEESCAVYGMPRASAELGAVTRIVPLQRIPGQILEATRYRKRA